MLEDSEIGRPLPVDVYDAALLGIAVCDFGDVPQQNRRGAYDFDRNAAELRYRVGAGIELNGVVGITDAGITRGQNYV